MTEWYGDNPLRTVGEVYLHGVLTGQGGDRRRLAGRGGETPDWPTLPLGFRLADAPHLPGAVALRAGVDKTVVPIHRRT